MVTSSRLFSSTIEFTPHWSRTAFTWAWHYCTGELPLTTAQPLAGQNARSVNAQSAHWTAISWQRSNKRLQSNKVAHFSTRQNHSSTYSKISPGLFSRNFLRKYSYIGKSNLAFLVGVDPLRCRPPQIKPRARVANPKYVPVRILDREFTAWADLSSYMHDED